MSGKLCNPPAGGNGRLRERVRFLVAFAAAVAAVVVFAWASQARQDEKIGRNETAVAVLKASVEAKLESIDEKLDVLLDDMRDILRNRE